jgi:hypothetical protein
MLRMTKANFIFELESIEWFIEACLSCGRMIWLLANPLPPSLPFSICSLFLGPPVCRRSSLMTRVREGEGVGEDPNRSTQESLALYKSFNTVLSAWLEQSFTVHRHENLGYRSEGFHITVLYSIYFMLQEAGAHYCSIF